MQTSEPNRLRAYAAQTVAVLIKNLVPFNNGLSLTYPDILIAALTGQNAALNPNETIRLTAQEASWLGSLGFAAQVAGSILSGFLGDALGRKTALILLNIPFLVGWYLFYSATSIPQFYSAAFLFGLAVGQSNSPVAVYAGEVSEKSIRDIMTGMTGVLSAIGISIIYIVGNLTDWRTIALFCSAVPIITSIIIFFIPETPIWLLSKNREEEALKSLCWLRGWTTKEAVQEEFDSLKKYQKLSNACDYCQRLEIDCTHPPPAIVDRFSALLKPNCMKPIIIFTICSLFTNIAGIHHINPFIVQILNTFKCPFNPNKAISIFGPLTIITSVSYTLVVNFVGKRKIYFTSFLGMAACSLALGIYAIIFLPSGVRSFDYANLPVSEEDGTYLPLIAIICAKIFSNVLVKIPVMYMSELFPFKARCLAAGICSAIFNLLLFATTASFYDMERLLSLSYTLCIYGASAIVGILVIYPILPRTENVTLADIERHFSNKQHRWTDWRIAKTSDN